MSTSIKRVVSETLFHRRSFKEIRMGEPIYFFDDAAIGAHASDGHIYLPDETNLSSVGSIPKGHVFQLRSIDVDGVPVGALNRVTAELILGNVRMESGPLDILRRMRCEDYRVIDALRSFRLCVRCYDVTWIKPGQVLRAELWGHMLSPIQ